MENKWRASRYGLDGKMTDLGKEAEVPCRERVEAILEFVGPVLDEIGSRSEVEYTNQILENGAGIFEEAAVAN